MRVSKKLKRTSLLAKAQLGYFGLLGLVFFFSSIITSSSLVAEDKLSYVLDSPAQQLPQTQTKPLDLRALGFSSEELARATTFSPAVDEKSAHRKPFPAENKIENDDDIQCCKECCGKRCNCILSVSGELADSAQVWTTTGSAVCNVFLLVSPGRRFLEVWALSLSVASTGFKVVHDVFYSAHKKLDDIGEVVGPQKSRRITHDEKKDSQSHTPTFRLVKDDMGKTRCLQRINICHRLTAKGMHTLGWVFNVAHPIVNGMAVLTIGGKRWAGTWATTATLLGFGHVIAHGSAKAASLKSLHLDDRGYSPDKED